MTEYEQHIEAAKACFRAAPDKVDVTEGILDALLGIGEVLLAKELREKSYEEEGPTDFELPPPPRPSADRG